MTANKHHILSVSLQSIAYDLTLDIAKEKIYWRVSNGTIFSYVYYSQNVIGFGTSRGPMAVFGDFIYIMTSVGRSAVSVHNTTEQRTRRKYFLPVNNAYLDLAVAIPSITHDAKATSTFHFPLCGPKTYYRKINGTLNCTCMEGYSGECNSCQASCPSDWLHIESSCYFFSAKTATWDKARKLCQQKGGNLAVPKNNAENNAISRIISRKPLKSHFIGLYRNKSDNQFYTVQNVKPTFALWYLREPNNVGGVEDCVVIDDLYYKSNWNVVRCVKHLKFICQRERRNLNYIGECQSSPCGKDHSCINIPGSYECLCSTGYKLDKSKKICINTNECKSSLCGFCYLCYNTPGSYYCRRNTWVPSCCMRWSKTFDCYEW
ncbi:fibrillin-1-like isoform X2 [Xenia sp. Carnegie-2017]|uniref:fibrillin-1-like isoform X2 n=1 Tax=Xenia sp. Carnegie-2017 TaxID=2897299 RepID=UPI001F0388E9|nr:fibrillin-1-like isoform X2 [Xenia sp. Carnegie-2017]